jgi:hypothetical protein
MFFDFPFVWKGEGCCVYDWRGDPGGIGELLPDGVDLVELRGVVPRCGN